MERRLDELDGHLQQQRHAQAAGADARDGQPDDPDDGADEGDDDGEEREGKAQEPPQGPALAVAAAAHPLSILSSPPAPARRSDAIINAGRCVALLAALA